MYVYQKKKSQKKPMTYQSFARLNLWCASMMSIYRKKKKKTKISNPMWNHTCICSNIHTKNKTFSFPLPINNNVIDEKYHSQNILCVLSSWFNSFHQIKILLLLFFFSFQQIKHHTIVITILSKQNKKKPADKKNKFQVLVWTHSSSVMH